jgi:hypothetical protein
MLNAEKIPRSGGRQRELKSSMSVTKRYHVECREGSEVRMSPKSYQIEVAVTNSYHVECREGSEVGKSPKRVIKSKDSIHKELSLNAELSNLSSSHKVRVIMLNAVEDPRSGGRQRVIKAK